MTLLRKYGILLIILLLASWLRLYNLSNFPVGLHGDEASIGYNAYSLLKTGRDQDGRFLPLTFDQFGNFRAAGYHYFDVPFVALLGLNTLAVRLPAALFGILSIIVFYLLVAELFENKHLGLFSAFLLAILPWHINLSRASSESIIAMFFVLLGLWLLFRELKEQTPSYRWLSVGTLSLIISIFCYHASAIFIPLFLPFLFLFTLIIYKPTKIKVFESLIIYVILIASVILFLTIGGGKGRASQVGLLNIPEGTKALKIAMDEEGTLNPILTRFYDNKLYFFGRLFLTFYSDHLTGEFLFVNTGLPVRYKIPFTGNLYLVGAPFLLIGLAILITEGLKKKKYIYLIPVAWLFLGLIPAALTWEDLPNVVRSSLAIPALMIITAFGFFESLLLLKGKWKTILIIGSSLMLLQNFLYFYHNYFWRLKVHEPWHRSAAEPDLIFNVIRLSKNYSKIVMTTQNNNNLIFYLFYTKFDPATFQRLGSPREHDGLVFQNLIYTYSDCPIRGNPQSDAAYSNELFVDKPECPTPRNSQIVAEIRTPDGAPAFKLVKLLKEQ